MTRGELVRVELLGWTGGRIKDPRRILLLAFKVSSGKLACKSADYYLNEYPEDKVKDWVIKAARFPSVLEHVYFTFLLEDVSRVTSHQLVRHRIASYTQESQRYSSVSEDYVIPETISSRKKLRSKFLAHITESFKLYREMISAGVPYEDARYVLPQAVKTRILMTVNLRELIHIACLRMSSEAQWEIRELVTLMIKEASKVIPELPEILKISCGGDGDDSV